MKWFIPDFIRWLTTFSRFVAQKLGIKLGEKVPMIVGSTGQIGSAVSCYLLRSGRAFISADRRPATSVLGHPRFLDLRNATSIQNLELSQVSHLIFCAGLVGFDVCAKHPGLSRDVNVTGLEILANRCEQAKVGLTLISSNAVFSGESPITNEESNTSPRTEYGAQKEAQERIVMSSAAGKIIRLTKVMSLTQGLLKSWFLTLHRGNHVTAFSDLSISPLSRYTVAKFIVDDLNNNALGVRHLSADSQISYFKLAEMMCDALGVSRAVNPLKASAHFDKNPLYLPTYSYLTCERSGSRAVSMKQEIENIFRGL